jgi:predicted DNA-binding transcriptional regulator YafY
VARSEGQFRTYRVNQILGLTTHSNHFERAADFDLPAYWASSVTGFRAQLHRDEATIRLSPAGLQRMRETMSSAVIAAVDQTATADEQGWITAVVPIESADHAHGEFLRLGAEVEILSPAALRDRMQQTARSLARLYPAAEPG